MNAAKTLIPSSRSPEAIHSNTLRRMLDADLLPPSRLAAHFSTNSSNACTTTSASLQLHRHGEHSDSFIPCLKASKHLTASATISAGCMHHTWRLAGIHFSDGFGPSSVGSELDLLPFWKNQFLLRKSSAAPGPAQARNVSEETAITHTRTSNLKGVCHVQRTLKM